MSANEKLYNQIIDAAIQDEETALNTMVIFLTNLRGENEKLDWIIDSLNKIKQGA